MNSKRGKVTSNGANDSLRGAVVVQNFLNSEVFATPVSLSQVYNLIETRRIPAGKLGGLIIGSKAKIRGHFAELAAGAPGPEPRPAAPAPVTTRSIRQRRSGRGRG
jgi:hypothetical protein